LNKRLKRKQEEIRRKSEKKNKETLKKYHQPLLPFPLLLFKKRAS